MQICWIYKSDLFYCNKFSFFKHCNIEKFTEISLVEEQRDLKEFKNKLELFYNESKEIEPTNEDQVKDIKVRIAVLDRVFELYNKLLGIYTNQFNKPKFDKKRKIASRNKPENLSLKTYTFER